MSLPHAPSGRSRRLPIGRLLLAALPCLATPASSAAAQAAPPAAAVAAAVAPADLAALRAELAALEEAVRALKARLEPIGPAAPATDRLTDLDQQIRIVDRKLELDREQAAERTKSASVVGAGRGGFTLASADGAFQLRIRGYVQSDGRFLPGSGPDLPAPSTFVLRRVRPTLEGTLFKIVDFRIMPDFGGGTTVLQDAYVDVRFSTAARLRAGKFKSPVGLERLVSGSELPFIERALPTALAPNRDVGVLLFGDVLANRLAYAVGVTNGVADGSSGDLDSREGKDLSARLFAHPFRSKGHDRLQHLGIGVAGTYGTERGTPAAPALPSYRTTGQAVFARYRLDAANAAATAFADGIRWRVSPQGSYYAGPFGVLGEYIVSSQQVRRGTSRAALAMTAGQVAVSWVLTGEDSTARGVTPRQNFEPAKGSWGAFELTGRYHALALDRDAFPLFANPAASARQARAFGLGTNWYLNRALKITLDVEETRFEGGGASGDRAAEHAILSRVQVAY